MLRRTRFGLHVYAVGGDLGVARLSGIRTTRTLVGVYVTSSVFAALAGLAAGQPHRCREPNRG